MKAQPIEVFDVAGGMKLAVEPIEGAATTTIVWTLPVGSAGDPEGALGAGESTVLGEVIMRGAGSRSSRELSDALDRLGVQRASSSSTFAITIAATCLTTETSETLKLLRDIVMHPRIEEDSLEASRDLALQSLGSLTDDPQHYAGIKISEIAIPAPFNRHGYGTLDGLNALTTKSLHAAWSRRCRPGGSIIGVVGAIDPAGTRDMIAELVDGWTGAAVEPTATAPARGGSLHEKQASSQSPNCLATPGPKAAEAASLPPQVMVRILGGGGMSNRLFCEVREKRGLCYSVGSSYTRGRDRGLTLFHAASTPERASETLACVRTEVARMAQGVTTDEFARAILGLKSGVVMAGESSSARASALVGDLFRLGRVRTLAEVVASIENLTIDQVNAHAAATLTPAAVEAAALVVVGPAAL